MGGEQRPTCYNLLSWVKMVGGSQSKGSLFQKRQKNSETSVTSTSVWLNQLKTFGFTRLFLLLLGEGHLAHLPKRLQFVEVLPDECFSALASFSHGFVGVFEGFF